jgi:hypothetical protein
MNFDKETVKISIQTFARLVAFLYISLGMSSCEKDNGNFCQQLGYDSSGYLPLSTIDSFGDDSLKIWIEPTDTVLWYKNEKVFHVIQDQETFDQIVKSNREGLDINFEEFTLLIGYVFATSGPVELTEQTVTVYCNAFDQTVGYGVYIVSEHLEHYRKAIQFHAFITKIPDDIPISCGISLHEKNTNP